MSDGNSEPHRTTVAGPSGTGTSIVSPADLPQERAKWLWSKRIPLGSLTLLCGEPKAGKSYLTLDIAARTTRGGPWPGECAEQEGTGIKRLGPGSVLLVCIEDNWHDAIRPRLVALGADLSKIRPLSFGSGLTQDMRLEILHRHLSDLNDCRLIVIDPVTAFLNELGGTSGSQGRMLVYSLAECVLGRQTAMVLVTHLRGGKGKALHRPSGNDALVRAARAVWLLESARADPERRLLLPIKNNLTAATGGLAFTLESVGNGENATLCWDPEPVLASADDILRDQAHQPPPRDHKLCDAIDWLEKLLRTGPAPAGEVQRAAAARGISYGTLRRAFSELRVQSLRQPPGAEHPFLWQLSGPATTD